MPQAEKYQGKAPRGLVCGAHWLLTPLCFCNSFCQSLSFAVDTMSYLLAVAPT